MAVTQTKIPFGYGFCNIKLYRKGGLPGDPAYGNGYIFEVDTNSFVRPEEVKFESMTIYNARRKHIDGIHLSFNLRLKENSGLTDASGYCDADSILRFLHFYFKQNTEDNYIRLFPARSIATDNFFEVDNINNWVCLVDSVEIVNVVDDSRNFGQELLLKCSTKIPISKEDWGVFYRNTSNDGFFESIDVPLIGAYNDTYIYFT